MMHFNSRLARFRRVRLSASVLPLCAGLVLLGEPLQAKAPVPPNLAGNLDVLVRGRLDLQAATQQNAKAGGKGAAIRPTTYVAANGKQYASQLAVDVSNDSITNPDGRVLVMVHPNGFVPFDILRKAVAAAIPTLTITAVDTHYKGGVIEGWVDVDDAANLAETWGVASVMLEAKPEHNRPVPAAAIKGGKPDVTVGQVLTKLGTAFDQGVFQHRVDTINKYYNPSATLDYEGQGMQIACLSDSFGATTTVTPAMDQTNFDLPGDPANPAGNTTPVFVYGDYTGGTDEGRAMCQIVYKMCPKAAVGFATADTGEVGFANSIRGLAGLSGYTVSGQTFAADVICDDVGYQDEPFFEDGVVGTAVDDVSAAGVAYFSSAGNDIGTYDYDSDFRYVPLTSTALTAAAGNTALANTNINLTNVPTNLYQGGFHNFGTASAQDVACTYNVIAGTSLPVTNFQWNDPYNQTTSYNTPAIYTANGNITASSGASQTFTTPTLMAGSNYVIIESATNSSGFDGIVSITDPNGNVVVNMQDTGTDETVNFFPTVTGAYTITVSAYSTTGGTYQVNVYTGNNKQISTDFNLLVFDTAGNYLPNSSLVANNITTNVPYDAKRTSPASGQTQVQYVVSRSAVPTQASPANHFRILIRGNGAAGIGPAEYITVNTPNTKGHAMATTCNGTAAYSVFRPSIPEYYTSPGPATVYFDKLGNRLTTPDVRLQPRIAAADAANNSFFASDSTADLDTNPNFSGTSAAAPHAAACALLALQAHGGRRAVTPAQMTSLLQRSTFPHDLDPNYSTGVARVSGASSGKVTITCNSDRGINPSSGAFNPNSFNVSYVGAGSIATLTFNPAGGASTGGNTTGGNNGLDTTSTYFSNIYPGLVWEPATVPFAVGNASTFTFPNTIASFSNLAGAPSNGTNQYWTMTLTFPAGAFTGGNTAAFSVGHAPQHDSTVTSGLGAANGLTATASTQADLLGGTVLIPDGTGNGVGMTFSGTTSDGSTFSGTINNRIGAGYSVTDGYGFINAQAAVSQTVQ